MSVRLEVIPHIIRELRDTWGYGNFYDYVGFSLRISVYIIWDNGEYNTNGAKLTIKADDYTFGQKTNITFNKNKQQKGKELLGYDDGLFTPDMDDGSKYYYSEDILCGACYEGISQQFTYKVFPARNLCYDFKVDQIEHYFFDEQDQGVNIILNDNKGMSNRKWKITDYYGNIILQGDWQGTGTQFKKYWTPTESELDTIYLRSDTSENGKLIFDGNIDFTGTYNGKNYISTAFVHLETYGKHPTAVITIKDTDTITKTLTGDENKFIRYFSDMNINVVWTAYNGAEIDSYSTKYNVNYIAKNTSTINAKNIIDTKCIFTCSDTKGLTTTITRTPVLIPYTKLTCIFQPTMSLEGDISFTTSGNYFNSNFGVQNNSLTLQYRYKLKEGSYGNWIAITPTIEGNSYSGNVAFKIPDFQYQNVYVFQVKATDKLMEIFTPEYTVNSTPVFDWSKNDFNFNVPVTIKGVPVYVEEVLYNSTGTSDRDSTLISGKFSDYDYVEILYCDNNSRGWGSTKIYKPENDMIIHLSLVESNDNSGGFYFRHTNYKIQNDNEIVKEKSAYNYFNASSSTPYKSYAGNLIKIRRILGYRGIPQ